ncbi:hypothetical protein OESDEN_17703 [Oesophagostomum dentatum]|uniref:Uncharacterized protein n=1 Tax=Oesophagostomum dentatum TaxID=61180 RepID=A0A0B1SBD4_OESDE|nr:hypothetical protein OESDEN_17703 [Oesophagostomum dentatum]
MANYDSANKCYFEIPARAETTIDYDVYDPLRDIVSKCKSDSITHIWINTKPVGRILAQTRHLKQAGT